MKNQWTWHKGIDGIKKGVERIKKIVLRKWKTSGDVAQILSDKDQSRLESVSAPYKINGNKEPQSHALNFSANKEHLIDAINEQQHTIDTQQKIINKYENRDVQDSKTSQLMIAVVFASWGILSWTGATIYWQISPESWVQESTSSLAKIFSDEKTGYEIIQEGKENVLIVQRQINELKKCDALNGILQEVVVGHEKIFSTHQLIISMDEVKIANLSDKLLEEQKKSESCNRWGKRQIMGREEEKQSRNLTGVEASKIYATLSKLKSEMATDFPDKNIEMKIQEQSGGGMLVWIEYNGRKSLGFFADSPKNQNRLTKEGMNLWIQSSIDQLSLVEQIETIALSKNIGLSKSSSFVSMEIKKLYTGNVTVILSDSLSKKTGQFTVNIKKGASEDISKGIDKILESFLSNAAWVPLSEKTPQNIPPSDKNTGTSLS